MKKLLRNESGLTLIEVLAAAVIGTMLLLLIWNALLFGLKQYKNQSTKAQDLTDVTYIAKIITKDIRKAEKISIGKTGDSLFLTIDNDTKIYVFNESEGTLLLNERPIFSEIKSFYIRRDKKVPNILEIKITHYSDNSEEEKINTEIYMRKGVKIEEH